MHPSDERLHPTLFTAASRVVDMGFGPYGGTQALYHVTQSNHVRRIAYTGLGEPLAHRVATATPSYGAAPLTVNFNG